ncbi:lipoprotein signal peptide, partial [Pseudomonas protegens]
MVVLSEGYVGYWRNLCWLVTSMVGQGEVVAAPDHQGSTSFEQRPEVAAMRWERPRDLSRVI